MQSIPDKVTALRCQQDNPDRNSNFQNVFKVDQLDTPDDLKGRETLIEIKVSIDDRLRIVSSSMLTLPLVRPASSGDLARRVRQCVSCPHRPRDPRHETLTHFT